MTCQHEWLPENQYRLRRCRHCGAHPFQDAVARLRRRVHVHAGDRSGGPQPVGTCYGSYETCGEHHAHSPTCGARTLVCDRRDDQDGIAVLRGIDALLRGEKLEQLT